MKTNAYSKDTGTYGRQTHPAGSGWSDAHRRDDNSRNDTGRTIGLIAAGVAMGVAAAIGRKVAVQAPTAMAGDWADGLKAEHDQVTKLIQKLEATAPDSGMQRRRLVQMIKSALTKHALEEENVVYPAMMEAFGEAEAKALVDDHAEVKLALYKLETLDPASPEFMDVVRTLSADLVEHMAREEDELFPRLRDALGEDGNRKLKLRMNREGLMAA